jgi:hypothetical protein
VRGNLLFEGLSFGERRHGAALLCDPDAVGVAAQSTRTSSSTRLVGERSPGAGQRAHAAPAAQMYRMEVRNGTTVIKQGTVCA